MHTKINDEGQYCPFPGTTVIASIQEADLPFWQTVYNVLNDSPIIRQYYTPLPPESYHMTFFSLPTIKDIAEPEKWPEFIQENMPSYRVLHNALQLQQQNFPEIRFRLLSEAGGITLEVKPSREQVKVIRQLAEQHHCKERIPSYFHITLAYQYKSLTAEDHPHIIKALAPLHHAFKQKAQTTLNPPGLYYFNDMTCFKPWAGVTNPFAASPSLVDNPYSFYDTLVETTPSAPSCGTVPKTMSSLSKSQ